MAIDFSQFVLAPALQQLFRDKDTGNPLANGKVFFFEDKARTIPKPVFQLTGSPSTPVFIALPNPVILNDVGAFDDAIYYNPFDVDGNIDLYFIEVKSSTDILQLTRESYPDITAVMADASTVLPNFIPNGQFLIRRSLPDPDNLVIDDDTVLDYGGIQGNYHFIRTTASTSIDKIDFDRLPLGTNPETNPRYALRHTCESPNAGDTEKDILIAMYRVNEFSSATDTFTFQMEAKSNSGADLIVSLVLDKVYGTNGSATTFTPLTTFTLTPTSQKFTHTFVFNDDDGKTLGDRDNDGPGLRIKIPTDIISASQYTNFLLVKGEHQELTYPYQSTKHQVAHALGGSLPIPNPDRTDEGKFVQLQEITAGAGVPSDPSSPYPRSESDSCYVYQFPAPTGSIFWWPNQTAPDGYLFCNGGNVDLYSEMPPIFAVRLNAVVGSTYGVSSDTIINTTSGGVDKGNYTAALPGAQTAPDPATSGFTIVVIVPGDDTVVATAPIDTNNIGSNYTALDVLTVVDGTFTIAATIRVDTVNANGGILTSTILDGGAYTVSPPLANKPTGGTGSGAQFDLTVTRAHEETEITFPAGAGVTAGTHFILYSNGRENVFWYSVDGVGIAPSFPTALIVEIAVLSSDTATQVRDKTIAIQYLGYKIPDLRGLFIRGWNDNSGRDPNNTIRTSGSPSTLSSQGDPETVVGDVVPSLQDNDIQSHYHFQFGDESGVAGGANPGIDGPNRISERTQSTGGAETRPINMYLMPIIKN